MYFRIHNKLINIKRNNYNNDEEFYEAIMLLKYNKINSASDKLFSINSI